MWLSITKGYEKDVVVRAFSSLGGNFCWNPKKIQREKEKKKKKKISYYEFSWKYMQHYYNLNRPNKRK